jgi:hypothetical protein
MSDDKSKDDEGHDWQALIAERAEAFGLPQNELEEAVQRELLVRVSSRIAKKMVKEIERSERKSK